MIKKIKTLLLNIRNWATYISPSHEIVEYVDRINAILDEYDFNKVTCQYQISLKEYEYLRDSDFFEDFTRRKITEGLAEEIAKHLRITSEYDNIKPDHLTYKAEIQIAVPEKSEENI